MTISSLLDRAIPLPISLAKLLGRSAALFLQQLHYHLRFDAQIIDGEAWFCQLYSEWSKELGLSTATLKRIVAKLKTLGLIAVEQFYGYHRDNSYQINYDELSSFTAKGSESTLDTAHFEPQIDNLNPSQTTTVVSKKEKSNSIAVKQEESIGSVVNPSHSCPAQPPKPLVKDKSSASLDPAVENFLGQLREILVGNPSGKLRQLAVRSFQQDAQAASNVLSEFRRQRQAIKEPIAWLIDGFQNGREVAQMKGRSPQGFREWFEQAYAQGWVVFSRSRDGVQEVMLRDTEEWLLWEEAKNRVHS